MLGWIGEISGRSEKTILYSLYNLHFAENLSNLAPCQKTYCLPTALPFQRDDHPLNPDLARGALG